MQLVKKFPTFMEPESSSPYPQVLATCPHPEPTPSSPHDPLQLPEVPGDPAVQNPYQFECKKRQLSAFIHGIRPSISTAVQLQAPKTGESYINYKYHVFNVHI
jgi:hypothetical protein